jgi:periplasmic protein TonB
MTGVRVPLVLSICGHAALLAALAWLTARPLLLPTTVQPRAVTVVFAAPPAPTVAPTPPPPAPPPPVPAPPPPPPPPVAEIRPPPPPPLPKPVIERRPVHVVRRREEPPPLPAPTPPPEVAPRPPQPSPPTQVAALPPPRPAPAPAAISAAWRAELGAWLQSHKSYPESARDRGEEGEAVLRFRVDRSGRVLDYAVVRSSGYPDLDASIKTMMQGATLPAFPDTMPQPQVQVSVAIRFALR